MVVTTGQCLAGRFELLRRLGAGGMGVVYLAHDRERDERVALKLLRRAEPAAIVRFKREFRALQNAHHANLVRLGELFGDPGGWFFTMELIDGQRFLPYVRQGTARVSATADTLQAERVCAPAYDERRLRECLRQLVVGLRFLHRIGMVHRDIKPSNVLVTPDERVVILDFGLVVDADPAQQSTEALGIGTPEYVSPEQAAGNHVSEAADWYSVGVMLFEALTGELPFAGSPMHIFMDKQQREAPSPREYVAALPDDLCALCEALLCIEPESRPDGAEIAARLNIDATGEKRLVTVSRASHQGAFVGRTGDLQTLYRAYGDARAGSVLVVIEGESGIGKSELMRRFAQSLAAAEPDAMMLEGRCFESESVPYKALDGVVDRLARELSRWPDEEVERILPRRAALLPRLFPALQRVDPVASAPAAARHPEDAHEHRRRSFQALRILFRRIGERRPVVVTIDDLQWADSDSFVLLRALLAAPKSPAMLVVATCRAEQGSAAVDVAAQLPDVEVRRLALGPLADEDIRELSRTLAPRLEGTEQLARIVAESHGHPLFAHELVRYLEEHGGDPGDIRLDQALGARVEMLTSDARALLEAVCVAAAPLDPDVAMHVSGSDATALGRAVSTLRVALLARSLETTTRGALEPYHGRVRGAVLGRMSEDAQVRMHRRLALAFEAAGYGSRDPQLLVTHFARAGERERAARYAEDAADRAENALAFEQAAELWNVALTLHAEGSSERRRLQLRLGDALMSAGRSAQAATVFLEAATGGAADRSVELACRRKAAEQLLLSGRIAEGLEVLEAVLADIGVAPPRSPRRALAAVVLRRAWLRMRGTGWRERTRRDIPEAELVRIEILNAAAKGLALVDSVRGADCQARALHLALELGEPGGVAHALTLEAMYQANQSSFRRSRALLGKAAVLSARLGEPYLEALVEEAGGVASYFEGGFRDAVRQLANAEAMFLRLPGMTWEINSVRLFRLFAMRNVGDFVAMRQAYDRYIEEAINRGDQYAESSIRRCSVRLWLAAGDLAEARRELDRACWEGPPGMFHVAHFHELTARGEIALYSGDAAGARATLAFDGLRRSLLIRVGSVRTQADFLAGRLALASGDLEGVRAAARIARRLGGEKLGFAHAWAAVLAAGVAARRDDLDGALNWLSRAQEITVAHDMRLLRAAACARQSQLLGAERGRSLRDWARRELDRLGVRDRQRMVEMLAPGFDAA